MKLRKFRVTNFRSVDDSGWIDVDDVTALIGTNESGKTNILLPLWKLNPAKEGEIVPTSDYPRKLYNQIRNQSPKPVFISAVFELPEEVCQQISEKTGMPPEVLRDVEVRRRFDRSYEVDFPNALLPRVVNRQTLESLLSEAERDIGSKNALKTEEEIKSLLVAAIQAAKASIQDMEDLGQTELENVHQLLMRVKTDGAPKSGTIAPRHVQLCNEIDALVDQVSKPHPRDMREICDLVISKMPKFVYYSTYGNLDSEIYLPHVIANLKRTDLGLKEQAKARTLKVLFEFVRLSPTEIQELGHDFKDPTRAPTEAEIADIAEKKKQRSILLQSASTQLTKEFRSWWKQGEYRFRFEADGDHFRIWVSDDKRPEEIELEGRSTGLQWFLSFYLVFLVERADAHDNAILLLDEPGLSLHPLAQRDLSFFFNSLAENNQIIYTCHSPFLVEADRLDRARKVFVAADGTSKVTSDLRAADGDIEQRGAAYAVHAALGLSVAESLLLGCQPVIVEGPSDQHCLTAVKILLTAAGKLKTGRELIFPPAGGAKGVKAVASIVGARNSELPFALFDSDIYGKSIADTLRKDLYSNEPERILDVADFTGISGSEVEDLIPVDVIVRVLDRWQRTAEVPFAEKYVSGQPIVPQIEAWAKKYDIALETPGWKVELAKRVKRQLLDGGPSALPEETLNQWSALFAAFEK